MMNLKEDIFYELKSRKIKANEAWVFQNYNNFRADLPYTVSLEEFQNIMNELCLEGYFVVKNITSMPMYILTKKCEEFLININ